MPQPTEPAAVPAADLHNTITEPSAPVLVTVIVRSMDRPLLQQALASLAAQTHPHIEALVVAVHAGHAPLPATLGPHALRLITTETPRPRSVAANVGLDQARGRCILFLDDDDWLMPGHIARLVQALQQHPSARAAYTGVALVDAENRPLGQTFDLPFDAVRQMAGNLTPIHAVLFDAGLVAAGCRFDEALDRYEDWDFWLQLARHTVFVHLPGVSAVYRIHDSSGVHEDVAQASLQLYAKWQGHWGPREIGELMRRVWSHAELETQLNTAEERRRLAEQSGRETLAAMAALSQQLEQRLELRLSEQAENLRALSQQLAEQSARTEAAHAQNRALLNSTSWQVTLPLRWIIDLAHAALRPFRR